MKNAIAFLSLGLMMTLGATVSVADATKDATQRVIERVFSATEKAIIEEYFGVKTDADKKDKKHKHKGLPPGLAKKDKLPPGLQKQLEKNGRLPPGLAKNELPASLQNKLYPPKKGTRRYVVGNDVVLIDTATDVILDIIRGVIRNQR